MAPPRVDIHFHRGRVEVTGGPFEEVVLEEVEGFKVKRSGDDIKMQGHEGECILLVPDDTDLNIHGHRLELSVLSLGSVTVHTHEGHLDIADVSGPVDVHAHAAEVCLDRVDGPIAVTLHRGEVAVTVPLGTGVDADLRNEHGEVANTCALGDDVKIKVRMHRGDLSVVEAGLDR